mmetsp:Transcript_49776/g.159204  ORF Transcript_49776/g.159204 Transcript_49776/m.159204 type:complete len:432 (+) Transcript_49776:64-1359(+)
MSGVARKALLVFAVAPCPFFLLGIPCAAGWPSHAFRTTCVLFATFSVLAFSCPSKAGVLTNIALISNETASGIISAYWCAGDWQWLGLMAAENLFVVTAVCLLLEPRWTLLYHMLFVTAISVAGYYYWDALLARLGQGLALHVPAGRRMHDSDASHDADSWAGAIIVCVLALILGIAAIGYLNASHIRSLGRWVRDTVTGAMRLCGKGWPKSTTEVSKFNDLLPVERISEGSTGEPPSSDHCELEVPGYVSETEEPGLVPDKEGTPAPAVATRAEEAAIAAEGADEGVAGEAAGTSSEDEETASQHSEAASIGSSVGSWLSHYSDFMFAGGDMAALMDGRRARDVNEAMFSVHVILRAKLPAEQLPEGVLCNIVAFLLDARAQEVAEQRVMRRLAQWSHRRPLRRVGHWFRRLLRRRERLAQPQVEPPPLL